MSSSEQALQNEIKRLRAQLSEKHDKNAHMSMADRLADRSAYIEELLTIIYKYQAWFNYHASWVAHHNRIIQWNPNIGLPMVRGGNPKDGFPEIDLSTDNPQLEEGTPVV